MRHDCRSHHILYFFLAFVRIIAEEKRKAEKMKESLKKQEELNKEAKETYQSLQSEVASKTKKLTKFFHKLQNAEQEIKDLQVIFYSFHKALYITVRVVYL